MLEMNKIQSIVESFFNGQKKQMVNQIKEYGVNKFHIDLGTFLLDQYQDAAPLLYEKIVKTYHRINTK